jgi:hypothetical protein
MKIFCKFMSFFNFLFLEAATAAVATVIENDLPLPRRYSHRGYGAAAAAPPWTSLFSRIY